MDVKALSLGNNWFSRKMATVLDSIIISHTVELSSLVVQKKRQKSFIFFDYFGFFDLKQSNKTNLNHPFSY